MPIEGDVTQRAGDRTARLEGAAIREARRREMMALEAGRQAMYRRKALADVLQVAEADLARVKREAEHIEAEIAEAREVAAQTGHRAANLHILAFQAAESPALVAAAERRVQAARDALAAAEPVQAPAEPEPADKPRGRR